MSVGTARAARHSQRRGERATSLFLTVCLCAVCAQVALERGNATWRRLGWIVCLTADRSAIDLRDLRLNSSHLFVHRTAETISMRADDRALLVPARMMPGQPGVLVTFQLPNESGQDAIDRYYRITGNRSEAPSKLLPLPVRTESRKLRIDQDEFDSAADSLSLNTEEWSGRRKEERATALTTDSVQLFALGFNDAAFELERKTGACARFSQMAGAFGDMPNALPVQRVSRLADILPVLLVSPSRSVWVVSHGGHDGTYGSDSRSDVIAFLRHLHESVEQLSTLILFGCDLAQAVLSEVRHVLCPELEGPLRFHLLAFHDPIYGTNCNAADLMRSMLSEDLRFCNIHASQDARDTMRAHRADARRLFQQMGVRPLAEQGFTKLEKLSFVEQALVLCTVRNEELPAQEANDAEFVPCSVYLHFLDKFGRVIGAGADVDANAEIIAGLAGLGSSA